jgi:hypothetical protein
MKDDMTEVEVTELPQCSICGEDATYDGKTVMGPWGYMCQDDFEFFGVGVGTGLGQRLVLAD